MPNEINKRLNKLEAKLDQGALLDLAYKHFVSITPIDQGNARRSTKKLGSDTIHADYAYATRLDNGWSKQYGGKGMSQPTIEYLQKYIRKK
jgi:hypothetical protein